MIRAIKNGIEKRLFFRHWLNQKFLKKKNLHGAFHDEINRTNLFRTKVAVIFSLLFLIIQYIINEFIETPWTDTETRIFLYLDLSLFFILSLVGIIVFTFSEKPAFVIKLKRILPQMIVFIVFIWGALISIIESRHFEYFPTYSLIIIVFSWYFLMRGSTLIIAHVTGFTVLILGNHVLPAFEKQPDNYYQIVIAVTFISWVISRTLYHNREQIFIERIKLQIANQNLENRVRERTDELTKMNEKLTQEVYQRKKYAESLMVAKQKAEESDRLKSAFLANTSHEIRTPMNGIIGFSSLLLKRNLTPEKSNKYLDLIQNNCKQLLVIIDDILDLSKIEANQVKLNHTPVNGFELVDEIVEVFKQYKKHIKKDCIQLAVEKNGLAEPPCFMGDPSRIQQILNNLMRNALKFTQKGSITLGIMQKTDEIVFYVTDTGTGIPKEKQPYIFDRFYQGDDTMIRKQGGAGLGLSISRGLAELMKGKIWFESEEFKGTTFYLALPYMASPKKTVTNNSSRNKIIDNTMALSHKNVLIVEDEYTCYLVLKDMMLLYNARVTHALNGKEALEICKNNPLPDIVLMDIQLPEMDGYETTQQLKKLYPRIPVIAQTANNRINETANTLFDDVLYKPLYEEKLIEKLVKTLQVK